MAAPTPTVTVNRKEALRQGYHLSSSANKAARRALRWMRSRTRVGERPPSHIKSKIDLLQLAR